MHENLVDKEAAYGKCDNRIPDRIQAAPKWYLYRDMHPTTAALQELFDQIPRRHSADNVKALYALVTQYESLLMSIEAINPFYEKQAAAFFTDLDQIRASVKKSTDNKASKKNKDDSFDEASVALKTSIESLIEVFGNGEN